MLLRPLSIQSEFIARLAQAIERDPRGRRRAALVGAQLGFVWAVIGRVWMRQISDEQVFSVVGTLLILLVVSGFGAAAGYAFAARRAPARSRARRWWHRLLAWLPLLGMGPFVVFFLGQVAYAWRNSHPAAGRTVRWLVGGGAILVIGFWTLVFVSQSSEGSGWASGLLYLALGYLLYTAMRFAFEPVRRDAERPPSATA